MTGISSERSDDWCHLDRAAATIVISSERSDEKSNQAAYYRYGREHTKQQGNRFLSPFEMT